MSTSHDPNQLDHVTSTRLAKLSLRAVDASELESRLGVALSKAESCDARGFFLTTRSWWRPLLPTAAALLLVAAVAWLTLQSGASPAIAAPAELAEIHFDVTNGLTPHLQATDIEQVNRLLSQESSAAVTVPPLPGTVVSCCMHGHAGEMLACVVIERDGVMITVAVANAANMHSPADSGRRGVLPNGAQYVAHSVNGINMVMTTNDELWICVMGATSFDALIETSTEIVR